MCTCLQSSVNARVIYSNCSHNHILTVWGIQHDYKRDLYIGYINCPHTWSHNLVYSRYNRGPFYRLSFTDEIERLVETGYPWERNS
jgi:hypothetical protein